MGTIVNCSIIIRTLNEERYLGELLDKIAQQSYPSLCREVIVVDSGSTDRTLEIAASRGCRVLKIRREDFSFGRSLNVGCDAAIGSILVFTSGHCVPASNDWLWELVRPLEEGKVGVTYGRQIGGPMTKLSEHSLYEKYFPPHSSNGQSPFFCNNANAAFRRSAWKEWRFDETLTGLEDMYLAKQLHGHGWRVMYVPTAVVIHHHHEKWKQVCRRYEREALALQRILPEVHVYWHDACRYFSSGVLGDFSRALARKCLARHFLEILLFRFCQFYGAWKGNHIHRRLSRIEKERYFFPN